MISSRSVLLGAKAIAVAIAVIYSVRWVLDPRGTYEPIVAIALLFATNLIDPVVRRIPRKHITVVTDPRFIESAVFFWIFSRQPLSSTGVRFVLQPVDWRSVPRFVSGAGDAIGFYNRRALDTVAGRPVHPNLLVWTDLTLYRGYALIARAVPELGQSPSLSEARSYIARVVEEHRARGSKPTLVCMGGDAVWKMETPLVPEFTAASMNLLPRDNPDDALKLFLAGHGDFFLGGLPQRLAARTRKCTELLTYENNPLLFSINSLLCTAALAASDLASVSACAAAWYAAIARMKSDPAFLAAAATECVALLSQMGFHDCNVKTTDIELLFGPNGKEYEDFPVAPARLLDQIMADLCRIMDTPRMTDDLKAAVLRQFFDIVDVTLPNEATQERVL